MLYFLVSTQVLWCFTGWTPAIAWCSGSSLAILQRTPGAPVLHWLYFSEHLVLWCSTGRHVPLVLHWLYFSDHLVLRCFTCCTLASTQVLWCFTGWTPAIACCSGISLAILLRMSGAPVLHWLYFSERLVLGCFTSYTLANTWCSHGSLAVMYLWCFTRYTLAITWCSGASLAIL